MATLYRTVGGSSDVSPENGKKFKLGELNTFVGGDIEIIYLNPTMVMVVNENGRLLRLSYNESASKICGVPIVGNALYCHRNQIA